MTQIIGIVHRQGILIASESRYTAGGQITSGEKIIPLQLQNGAVVIAECGVTASVREYVEQMKAMEREENKWKFEHELPIRHRCSKCNCSFEASTKEKPSKEAHCPKCGNDELINM